MSAVALESPHAVPLSRLSEDEQMFRDTVRQFAGEIIGPLVRKMDEEQHFHPSLLPQLFNLGLKCLHARIGGAISLGERSVVGSQLHQFLL